MTKPYEAGLEALVAVDAACVEMWEGPCSLFEDEDGPAWWHVCCEDDGHAGPHRCPCGAEQP